MPGPCPSPSPGPGPGSGLAPFDCFSPAYALIFLAYRPRRHIGVFTMIIDRLIRIAFHLLSCVQLETQLTWYSALNGHWFRFLFVFCTNIWLMRSHDQLQLSWAAFSSWQLAVRSSQIMSTASSRQHNLSAPCESPIWWAAKLSVS